MSRSYQINVSESLVHHVHVEDGIEAKLELLGILSPDRMGELLGEALLEQGYTVGNGVAVKESELAGVLVVVEVDLQTAAVHIGAVTDSKVEVSSDLSGYRYEEDTDGIAEAALRSRAQAHLESQSEALDEVARKAVSEQLEQALAEVRPELDAAVDATTRTALRERAGQLGEIIEVAESPSGEMTIKVRV